EARLPRARSRDSDGDSAWGPQGALRTAARCKGQQEPLPKHSGSDQADVRVADRRSRSGAAESRRQARQAVARDDRQEEAGHAACPAGPGRFSGRRAYTPGLRLSECFGLKWIDFDLENRTVRIERQFREERLIDRTKKNKVRLVDLSREVVREFRAHRNWMEQDAAARGLALSPFVFTTTTGGPIRAKSSFTRKVLRPLVALAGLQRRVTFQNFRQTFCTDLVQTAGERGLLYASEQAGHSSISITADYYGRGASKDKSLVDSLDERVRRAGRRSGSTPRP